MTDSEPTKVEPVSTTSVTGDNGIKKSQAEDSIDQSDKPRASEDQVEYVGFRARGKSNAPVTATKSPLPTRATRILNKLGLSKKSDKANCNTKGDCSKEKATEDVTDATRTPESKISQ